MFFKAFLALLFIIRLRRIPTHLSDYVTMFHVLDVITIQCFNRPHICSNGTYTGCDDNSVFQVHLPVEFLRLLSNECTDVKSQVQLSALSGELLITS